MCSVSSRVACPLVSFQLSKLDILIISKMMQTLASLRNGICISLIHNASPFYLKRGWGSVEDSAHLDNTPLCRSLHRHTVHVRGARGRGVGETAQELKNAGDQPLPWLAC